jgi:hypothetical protein
MSRRAAALAGVVMLAAAWARAESPLGVGVSATVGTLGAGGEVTVGVTRFLGVRAGAHWLGIDPGFSIEEGDVNTELRWLNYHALLDVHPFGNGFRISGGGVLNDNRFSLSADLTEAVTINGVDYGLTALNGDVEFEKFAPYVGLGYGNAAGKNGRWHFSFDLGVMFQGEPTVNIEAEASNPILQALLDNDLREEEQDIEEDLSDFKYYPVLSFGISFRF